MKLKDIEVDGEYAIGAPNASYGQWRRVRGSVTKVGVRGTVSGGYHMVMSTRANYVEFEVVQDKRAGGAPSAYKHRIVEDPAYAHAGGERTPERYGSETSEVKQVLRCPGSHVLMPWHEYLVLLDKHDEHEAVGQRLRDERQTRAEGIRERFKKLGYDASGYKDYCVEFDTEDAEKILDLLEHHAVGPPMASSS